MFSVILGPNKAEFGKINIRVLWNVTQCRLGYERKMLKPYPENKKH